MMVNTYIHIIIQCTLTYFFLGKDMVFKWFKHEHKERMSMESLNLKHVESLRPRVPSLIAQSEFEEGLLLYPMGIKFNTSNRGSLRNDPYNPPNAVHFCELIDILVAAHKLRKPLVHRDIALNNIFTTEDGKVCFNIL